MANDDKPNKPDRNAETQREHAIDAVPTLREINLAEIRGDVPPSASLRAAVAASSVSGVDKVQVLNMAFQEVPTMADIPVASLLAGDIRTGALSEEERRAAVGLSEDSMATDVISAASLPDLSMGYVRDDPDSTRSAPHSRGGLPDFSSGVSGDPEMTREAVVVHSASTTGTERDRANIRFQSYVDEDGRIRVPPGLLVDGRLRPGTRLLIFALPLDEE